MIRYLTIPFLAYILLVPLAAGLESFGGRGTIGPTALDEYLILIQVVFLANIAYSVKKRVYRT